MLDLIVIFGVGMFVDWGGAPNYTKFGHILFWWILWRM